MKKYQLEFLIAALGLLVTVILLWLPFGPKTTDFADGWINLPLVERTSFSSLIQGSRPLVFLSWKLASVISKDSYMGVGLVLAALFWGKSFALYAILRKMRLTTPALAFLIAILFMLYPADSGNFMMRALGRHTAVFFYFLAMLFLVLASQSKRFSPIFLVGMLLAEGTSALTAEQGLPLILFTPLLLLMIKECSKKKKVAITAFWYAILILAIFNFLLAEKPHQTKLFEGGLVADKAQYIKEIILSNLLAYKWVFMDSWQNILGRLDDFQWQYIFFALAISCIIGFIVYLLTRFLNDDEAETNTRRHFGVMSLTGLAIIGLSFSPYSVTSFRYEHSRVFYYAAAGAALVVGLIFSLIIQRLPRWRNAVSFILWGMVIFLITFNGLTQHAKSVTTSLSQQKILIRIVEQAPFIKSGTDIVFLTGKKAPFTKVSYVFRSALNWTYGTENIRTILCDTSNSCLSNINFEKSILFRYTEENDTILLADVPIEFQQNGIATKNYQPYKRIKSYVPFPKRAQNAFDYAPAPIRLAPQNWSGEAQTLDDRRVCDISFTGNCSLLFHNDGTLTTFSQKVNLVGNANQQVELSFWGKTEKPMSEAIPLASLVVFYNDGTQNEFGISGQLFKKWALQQLRFQTLKPYSSLLLKLQPNTQTGSIWLDNIRLSKDNSEITITNSSFEK